MWIHEPPPTLTRREALRRGLLAAAGLAIAGAAPGRAQTPAPKAKSVIQIWMWGGPCQIDTFDPKPDAGEEYTGPLNEVIPTNVDGIRFGQLMPNLATMADKLAILRSVTHGVNAHETASYIVQTGQDPEDRLVYPSVGAVVSRFKGYDGGYEGQIPPYVVLTKTQGRFSEAGFLGPNYKPFVTGGDPNRNPFTVEGIVAAGINEERQRTRRDLLQALDTLGNLMPRNPQFEDMEDAQERAYDLILGDGAVVFDLSQETDEVRERYGRNTFGQSCLAARRLVEQGVPYVTINYGGWDTHKRHFETMNQKLPQMDQGMAALLADLSERGLLDSTIVWWGGEFGRGPKVQWEEPWNGGRSHHGACFSTVLAGGGFRGGIAVGESDATGSEVADRPIHPRDIIRAIYEQLGIDPDGHMPNPRGLDLTVMPPSEGGGRLDEIL